MGGFGVPGPTDILRLFLLVRSWYEKRIPYGHRIPAFFSPSPLRSRTHSNLNSNKRLTLTLGSEESSNTLYGYYRYRVEREIYLSSLAIDYTLLS
jgi:hypothetical protein